VTLTALGADSCCRGCVVESRDCALAVQLDALAEEGVANKPIHGAIVFDHQDADFSLLRGRVAHVCTSRYRPPPVAEFQEMEAKRGYAEMPQAFRHSDKAEMPAVTGA
jgi:hypothetical protein